LERSGHALIRQAVGADSLSAFREEATRLAANHPDQAHGIRDLLRRSSSISEWARSAGVCAMLPPGMHPVRGILFDKVPGANWKVAWHQDLTIAVQDRHAVLGYGPWSVKDGIVHVQPSMELLESMVTVRLHLDDTPAENGALKVISGSHRHGRLDAAGLALLRESEVEHICEAMAGDALLMKPLILHASSASVSPGHRRVVHVEYAQKDLLPPSLRWAEG
jgi:hypothetical protein